MIERAAITPECDERPIFDLFAAHMQSRVTEIALRMGMFEALREPSNIAALCSKVSIGQRAGEALLAVLAACRLVTISAANVQLTDVAREYLLADSPFFKGALFRLIPDEEFNMLRRIHLLDESPRPVTKQWLAGRVPDVNRQAKHMHAHSFSVAAAFGRHPIFQGLRSLLDVAGGAGSFSIALVLNNPGLHCTVMDLPCMASAAHAFIEQFQVSDEVNFVGGDIFTGRWDTGYDAVLFSNIFHDWSCARCEILAEKAFRALTPGGRILVNEMLLKQARDGPLVAAFFSAMILLNM
jgi:hypothetical protein